MSNQPKISILIATWNLENYIARALDSVFAQRHSYAFEVIVADDASNDGTMAILQAYRQRHPDHIAIIARDAKVGLSQNYLSGLEACVGEYIAMLDGDDYWIDADKLRKQVEFLDANPDTILSAHRFKRYLAAENRYDERLYPDFPSDCPDGFVIDPNPFNGNWPAHTSTIVLRRSALDMTEMKSYPSFKDTHLVFALLQRGKGYIHGFIGSEYTIRRGGHWHDQNALQRWQTDLVTIRELRRMYRGSQILKKAHYIFEYCTCDHECRAMAGTRPVRRLWLKARMAKVLVLNNRFALSDWRALLRGGSSE